MKVEQAIKKLRSVEQEVFELEVCAAQVFAREFINTPSKSTVTDRNAMVEVVPSYQVVKNKLAKAKAQYYECKRTYAVLLRRVGPQ